MGIVKTRTIGLASSPEQAQAALLEALAANGFEIASSANPIVASARRDIRRNRWASEHSILIQQGQIEWTIDMVGDRHDAIVDEVLTALPPGVIADLGGASTVTSKPFGATPVNEGEAKKRKVWPWVAAVAAVVIIIGVAVSGGDDDGSKAEAAEQRKTEQAEAKAQKDEAKAQAKAEAESLKESPSVIPLPLGLIESNAGVKFEAVDIGEHVVDGVSNQRGIFDDNNWRAIAQCSQMTDKLIVGAIKNDEFEAIARADLGGIFADNGLEFVLDCPA